jgi:transcription elongation factor GreA-like protein/transcription elongation GreA/GreB family factor
MSYLKDFRERIQNNDYLSFLKLWEEYCYGDQPDAEELILILQMVKESAMAKPFGLQVERVLPFWRLIQNPQLAHAALREIFDLQTTNSEELAALATESLRNRFPNDPLFLDKLRLVGLRTREHFQGCIRNFELLSHFEKGAFVFHTAGWGTGEIVDLSLVREEISCEFEYVIGIQHLPFEKAFKTLLPLSKDHFYARRFGNPDQLEEESRKNSNDVIRLLLRDLGPKTAAEIKEELCELVIPTEDWNRWWQTARIRMKKDTMIETPKEQRDPFRLRTEELPHEVALHQALESKPDIQATIQMVYTFLRDFSETLKNKEFKASLEARLREFLTQPLTEAQRVQILFFLEDLGAAGAREESGAFVKQFHHCSAVIAAIDVLAFQKRALQLVREHREDWKETFLDLLFLVDAYLLRDYLLQELLSLPEVLRDLQTKLNELLIHPLSYPDLFVWYMQKILDPKHRSLPFADPAGQNRFFEALLVLLDHVEERESQRDLAKKIMTLLTANRYKVIRDVMQQSSFSEVKEYLLLATKCQSFNDHDIKILHSLAAVVHPSLARLRKEPTTSEEQQIWTTQAGYVLTQRRIQHIATVETVQNAREIEAARALGDLRENAEFKAALERRDRLQAELKFLSDQLATARIITPEDVLTHQIGIGSVVHCQTSRGEHVRFTLLGPWDADPERHILSFQSKLAQALKGRTVGDRIDFQGEIYTITDIDSYFEQEEVT